MSDATDVEEPQGVAAGKLAAQVTAYVSRRAGDENLLHPRA
jgi:hypothetical protein